MTYKPGPKAKLALAQQGRCPNCASYDLFYGPTVYTDDDQPNIGSRDAYCNDCQLRWDERLTVTAISNERKVKP